MMLRSTRRARNRILSLLILLAVSSPLLGATLSEPPVEAQDSLIEVVSLTSDDSVGPRPSFFRRLYNYFEDSNEDKTQTKKIDFSVIAGPHYSTDVKFGLGIVAAGLYRLDKNDLSIPPSNVSIFGDVATSGFYVLGVRGNTFLKGGKYRVDYKTAFSSLPASFWGIGYLNGRYAPEETFTQLKYVIETRFMYRLAHNFYIGTGINFYHIQGRNFSNIDYLNGEGEVYTSIGTGAFLLYDSRDFITNAYKGIHLKLDQQFYPSFLGNCRVFNRTTFEGNFYKQLWKGSVLAYDFYAMFNNGDTPWTMLAQLGGDFRMRGYFEGRFRDKQMVTTQVELRQRVFGRHSLTTWVGAGNVFPKLNRMNWSQTLPNYGFGYRWEFKKRMNIRLDYGLGSHGMRGFIFNVNEAF